MAEVSGAPFARRLTGIPTADDIILGRGIVLGHELLTTTFLEDADGWFDLGECPEFAVEPTAEFVEHFSARAGKRVLDKKLVIQEKFEVRFGLEELNEKNFALYASATPESRTNAYTAGFTEYAMITAVELGRYYQIKNSSGVEARGITASDLTVEKSGAPDVALDSTDYELKDDSGMLFFKSTATHLADGDQVDVTLAAKAGADTLRRIPFQSRTRSVTIALKLLGEDPDSGRRYELWIPKITLAPAGAFNMISAQDWLRMGFVGSAEKRDSSTVVAYITPLPAAA